MTPPLPNLLPIHNYHILETRNRKLLKLCIMKEKELDKRSIVHDDDDSDAHMILSQLDNSNYSAPSSDKSHHSDAEVAPASLRATTASPTTPTKPTRAAASTGRNPSGSTNTQTPSSSSSKCPKNHPKSTYCHPSSPPSFRQTNQQSPWPFRRCRWR